MTHSLFGIIASAFKIAAAATFASLYESFQALTSIQVSHFEEPFSGDDIDTIWTKTNVTGVSTFSMNDSIDGGFNIVTDTAAGSRGNITFNDKRQYDNDASVFIGVARNNASAMFVGLTGVTSIDQDSVNALAWATDRFDDTNKALATADGTTNSRTESDIAIDAIFHGYKVQCGSADIKLTIDGVLKVTKTTNRPNAKLQPMFMARRANSIVGDGDVRYIEIHNTSITLLSTLYERLSALTQIIRQRVVETFTGKSLNERWTQTDVTGTGTFAMVDAVDEGFSISSGATTNNQSQVNFNNKRQYDFNDSVLLAVFRAVSTASNISYCGLSGNILAYNGVEKAVFIMDSADTNFALSTADASTSSDTEGSVAIDTSFHLIKVETGSANIKLTIDGVLDVTKTTNRPTTKTQPVVGVKTTTSAAKESRIRYLEGYNILTTETDFPSVYELFSTPTTVAKQHFWEWLNGNDLRSILEKTDGLGTGTFTMNDSIDGGYNVKSGSAASNRSSISAGDIRQFAFDGSVLIGVMKNNASGMYCGFSNDKTADQNATSDLAWVADLFSDTNKTLETADGTTNSRTASDIAIDAVFHVYKVECGSADVKLTIDGVLKVTKTTNRPTVKLQPNLMARRANSVQGDVDIRYLEVLNT